MVAGVACVWGRGLEADRSLKEGANRWRMVGRAWCSCGLGKRRTGDGLREMASHESFKSRPWRACGSGQRDGCGTEGEGVSEERMNGTAFSSR